ncbi:MAG: hypothetical protein HRT67_12475 [Flavobacteriaceae bacterium]|nr:hypothetical protein [Flavobacteriaceae bacterium]
MNDLNSIISSFTEEEGRNFISFLEKKNKRKDTKNIQLFKLLTQKSIDHKKIQHTLYKGRSQNAYHALRKRLFQSILEFLAHLSLEHENSTDLQIIKNIIAARSLLLKNQTKLAYSILDKAEHQAKAHHLFSLLNEIYHTKIQYAHTYPSVQLKDLIHKFNLNHKDLILEDQLNIVYAKIRRSLNEMLHTNKIIDFSALLTQTLDEHNISINDSMSFKSLYQLVTIVSISAFATNDYYNLEPFLIATYNQIQLHERSKIQSFYHIEVLYLIANTLFRNKKFEHSLSYLELMHENMQHNKRKYFGTFELKYNLLLALNHNYLNHQVQAIEILESQTNKKHQDMKTLLDIRLSLVMCYIQNKQLQKAAQQAAQLYHTDTWYKKKVGYEWSIKKHLIEIILHIELGNLDLVASRLLSFKRNYHNHLKAIKQERVITYLKFIEIYYKTPELVTTKVFHNQVEASFEWIGAQQEDLFVMSYYAWLKSKMEKQPLFKTTLDLIHASQTVNT